MTKIEENKMWSRGFHLMSVKNELNKITLET